MLAAHGPQCAARSAEITDSTPLDELELSIRAANCLREGGFKTVGDVRSATDGDLLRVYSLGRKTLNEIRAATAQGERLSERAHDPVALAYWLEVAAAAAREADGATTRAANALRTARSFSIKSGWRA